MGSCIWKTQSSLRTQCRECSHCSHGSHQTGAMSNGQRGLGTRDGWCASSSFWASRPPLLLLGLALCFFLSPLSLGAFPRKRLSGASPQWPPRPQFEINGRLTNILESPFHSLGERRMALPWLRGPVSLGWGWWDHMSQCGCWDP